ncbi:hypothetical protein M011DRAFT_405786 [Sporormia fimetaria CBS 119925]|uniref:Stress-response A/B barrel domain-containing protein n=1 Tax=Sporormia fimetaria CBS 119925 TaxID=1340428 RepID=A0A6A6V9B5_9PLEO|nr:hypothetical protein M011DRAFT_405786 [Sporormia fimetaria CBS 119925]
MLGFPNHANPLYWLPLTLARPQGVQQPLTAHIVLFQFKQGTSHTAIKEATSKMLGLGKACLHPSTRTPYIVSITGGKDNSNEGLQNGMTHAFILHFYSTEDRDYYVDHDPAHQEFKDFVKPIMEKAIVVDFLDGVFI